MEVVEEEGPFDAVMGFSQGSAMAATIMLHEAQKKSHPQPFKMGVFLSTTMPFDFGSGILNLQYKPQTGLKATHLDTHSNPTPENQKVDWLEDCRSATVIQEFEARRPTSMGVDEVEIDVNVLLRYHPSTHLQRLRLPTVHVVGMNDGYKDHGDNLYKMCDPNYATLIMHDGGHQLPRGVTSVTKVASAIMRAVEQM
jgi:hypothetical protein